MFKIIAPNSNYNGTSSGVLFVDGVGTTDNKNLVSWFKNAGYKVEETKEPKKTAAAKTTATKTAKKEEK